jgi:hypothetical protein
MVSNHRLQLTAGLLLAAGLCLHSAASSGAEDALAAALQKSVEEAASVQVAHIIANAIIRVAAIVAGVYVVWLGHNTMVRGIKGEFEFDGALGKLKGSTPGLLFVLLGVAAIGWSLGTKLDSNLNVDVADNSGSAATAKHKSAGKGSTIPFADPPPPPPP